MGKIARIRRISMYSQISVTMRPNAADQAHFSGTRFFTPFWIASKSMTSE